MKFGKLQKEFEKLDFDLQIHAEMLIEICEDIARISKKKLDKDLIVTCAVLHDSKNEEENHAQAGAEYARKALIKLGYNQNFIQRVYEIIFHHTDKKKVKDFTTACFYDADLLCRFYPLGILRAWAHNKTHHPERNWKELFVKVSNENNLKEYAKNMGKKLQLKESKKLLEMKEFEHLTSYKLLRELLEIK